MSISEYRPNTNLSDGDEIVQGSFNPDYVMSKQLIADDYFKNKSLNADDDEDDNYQPVVVKNEDAQPEYPAK